MTQKNAEIIARGRKIVLAASNMELNDSNFAQKVRSSLKINSPKLSLERTQVQIKEEKISFNNAPEGIPFSLSGDTVIEFAMYKIPIIGDMETFASLVGRYLDRRTTFVESNNLCYKEYSNIPITANDELINAIKNRVVTFTTKINNELEQFAKELDDFYETVFMPTINQFIELEITKRDLNSNSAAKLNPFA
jgi:hypothetical protein